MTISKLPISKIMSKSVITLEIPGSREQLLQAIRKHHFSVFPVVDAEEQRLRGVVGRREILRRPLETQLSLLMSEDVPVAKKTHKVAEVAKMMLEKQVSKVPITNEQNQVEGIVSISDIVWQIISTTKMDVEVADYYTDEITTVWDGTPASACVPILAHSGQSALPILVGKSLRMGGIISGNDLLKIAEVRSGTSSSAMTSQGVDNDPEWDPASILIIAEKTLTVPDRPVREIMTRDVVSCYEFSLMSDVAKKSKEHQIDQLPVVDEEGNLLGLLTNWHMLQAFVDSSK